MIGINQLKSHRAFNCSQYAISCHCSDLILVDGSNKNQRILATAFIAHLMEDAFRSMQCTLDFMLVKASKLLNMKSFKFIHFLIKNALLGHLYLLELFPPRLI